MKKKLPKTNMEPPTIGIKLVVWVDVSPFPFGGIFRFQPFGFQVFF